MVSFPTKMSSKIACSVRGMTGRGARGGGRVTELRIKPCQGECSAGRSRAAREAGEGQILTVVNVGQEPCVRADVPQRQLARERCGEWNRRGVVSDAKPCNAQEHSQV